MRGVKRLEPRLRICEHFVLEVAPHPSEDWVRCLEVIDPLVIVLVDSTRDAPTVLMTTYIIRGQSEGH